MRLSHYLVTVMSATVMLVTVMLSTLALPAAAVGDDPALDAVFTALCNLQPGQDLQQFQPIEIALAAARTDTAARTEIESRFVAILQGTSTDLAKDYACRQLARIGTDSCVPALATLLTSARASHMARQALESIGSPACRVVLRDALVNAKGRPVVGIVTSLGCLRDAEAVDVLSTMLVSTMLDGADVEVCEAAVVALGRIGTAAAATTLQEYSSRAPEALRDQVVGAQLAAATALARSGNTAASLALLAALDVSADERVRAAAFRGRIAAQPTAVAPLILQGLAAEEEWKRAVAADCLRSVRDSAQLEAIAAGLPPLPTAGKLAALDALCRVPDAVVRRAALQILEHGDVVLQVAALQNLVWCGVAEDVPQLVELATIAADSSVRAAAYETMRVMPAVGTNAAILAALERDAGSSPVLVRLALARRSPIFTPALLAAARATSVETRLAALAALEIMATPTELDALIPLLIHAAPGDERDAADRVVMRCCQQIADPAARTECLLVFMRNSSAADRCALLPTLARFGGVEALAAVHESMGSSDGAERDAGYRALANWPDATVADELLQIARSHETEAYRYWALRAYARVVSLPSDREPHATFEMLRGAMELANRQQDKVLILSRLGTVRTPDALALLVTMLDQTELRDVAVRAVFESAKGLSQSHPEPARTALQRILTMTDDAALKQQIPKVLRDMEAKQP